MRFESFVFLTLPTIPPIHHSRFPYLFHFHYLFFFFRCRCFSFFLCSFLSVIVSSVCSFIHRVVQYRCFRSFLSIACHSLQLFHYYMYFNSERTLSIKTVQLLQDKNKFTTMEHCKSNPDNGRRRQKAHDPLSAIRCFFVCFLLSFCCSRRCG